MPDTTARDLISRYVRLLGDWWTPPELTERRTEEVYRAVRAEVLAAAAAALEVTADAPRRDVESESDRNVRRFHLMRGASLLRRLAAAPTTACSTCNGSGLDPADEGDYDPAVQRHNPSTVGPCPACNAATNPTTKES